MNFPLSLSRTLPLSHSFLRKTRLSQFAMDYYMRHAIASPHGRLEYRLAPGGTAEIVDIEVASPARRRGIGRQMLERMIAQLPTDVKTVYAFTSAQSRIAHEWYRACGFTLTFVPGFYASMGEDAFCCVKEVK